MIRSGFHSKTHFNVVDTTAQYLSFAHKGLHDLGMKKEFLNILNQCLENRTAPEDYVANLWQSRSNGSVRRTLAELIQDIWKRTKKNSPII